jgi:hypothetical protein
VSGSDRFSVALGFTVTLENLAVLGSLCPSVINCKRFVLGTIWITDGTVTTLVVLVELSAGVATVVLVEERTFVRGQRRRARTGVVLRLGRRTSPVVASLTATIRNRMAVIVVLVSGASVISSVGPDSPILSDQGLNPLLKSFERADSFKIHARAQMVIHQGVNKLPDVLLGHLLRSTLQKKRLRIEVVVPLFEETTVLAHHPKFRVQLPGPVALQPFVTEKRDPVSELHLLESFTVAIDPVYDLIILETGVDNTSDLLFILNALISKVVLACDFETPSEIGSEVARPEDGSIL